MDAKHRFFSVSRGIKIDGTPYRPGMCYPIRGVAMERVAAELIAKGEAKGYAEEVRFVTGVPVPVKKPDAAAAPSPVRGNRLTVPSSASRKGRKG